VARRRVFSGIQPTGKLHLGNYIGAISLWVAAQAKHEAIFCIADLHALTIPEAARAAHVRARVREAAAILVACGIDPARAILFVQSHVPAHTQLAWLLSCVTPVGWLERMIQFKTRSAALESVGTGLLAYPVLQAADILLYRADLVPVGEDQQQHIEFTRDVARRFHALFGQVFTLPESMLQPSGARIMGLDDPSTKMSKSRGETRPRHAIGLVDPPDAIRNVVMHAVTDPGREVPIS
jgi:tryptophanyl-tRNA synthetase